MNSKVESAVKAGVGRALPSMAVSRKSAGGHGAGLGLQSGQWRAWLVAFGPSAAVILAGLTMFWDAVLSSVASTPHPELVYGIFAAYVMGLVLCAQALMRFQREAQYTRSWVALPGNGERRAFVEKSEGAARQWLSFPALAALTSALPSAERQAKFEREVQSVEAAFLNKLALPNYLAGALVGLGLVGTFVGLLGTLEDLGTVFGALGNAGDSSVNPTAVFADMVKKLQEPMKGMGTAFVSSLYGLLGSLVVGLCALSVSKSANGVLENLAEAERAYAAQHVERFTAELRRSESAPTHEQLHELVVRVLDAQASHDTNLQSWAEGSEKRFITLMDHMIEANRAASGEFAANSQKAMSGFMEIVEAQHRGTKDISAELAQQQQALIETVRAMSRQVHEERAALQKEMLELIERNRTEGAQGMARLEKAVDQITQVNVQTMQAMEQHIGKQEALMEGLPRTGYWKDAWGKVQDFLSRSRQGQDLSLMARTLANQTQLLEELSRQIALRPVAPVERDGRD
jgi:hypothetical protein